MDFYIIESLWRNPDSCARNASVYSSSSKIWKKFKSHWKNYSRFNWKNVQTQRHKEGLSNDLMTFRVININNPIIFYHVWTFLHKSFFESLKRRKKLKRISRKSKKSKSKSSRKPVIRPIEIKRTYKKNSVDLFRWFFISKFLQ